MKNRLLLIIALSGFFCVAFGAFASHGLSKILTVKELEWINIGLKYQTFHTLALFGVLLLEKYFTLTHQAVQKGYSFTNISWAWLLGILCFSGNLYLRALGFSTDMTIYITPLGGFLFLIGWGLLVYKSIKLKI